MTCHIAQGLYMGFYFGFSIKTVKVVNGLDRNLCCMATSLGMGLGFSEIKKSVNHSLYFNGAEATRGIRLPLKFHIIHY